MEELHPTDQEPLNPRHVLRRAVIIDRVSLEIDLTSDAIYTPEQLVERDRALDALALDRHILPPDLYVG